jgi:RNA polymerase sigma factor (sigma-70 family)
MAVDAAALHREVRSPRLLRLASDERLVALVRAGSERAFEALFDRHHRPVLAFCRHMLGSPADAEDAVQHTFLAAYRDLVSSEKPIVLRPWLYTIARHRCLSLLRTRVRQPVDELPEPVVDHLAAHVAARQDLRTILTDLARLPEDQRAALILAELGDLGHEDVARILGCQREKVKALVFQARSSLIADRAARETPCDEIRRQLATVGGALRRANLSRHVRECAGCRAFRHELRIQRRNLDLLLPVAPTLGLKRAVLGLVSGSGGAGTAGAAIVGGGSLTATALVTVAIAGAGATASAIAGGEEPRRSVRAAATAAQHPAPPAAAHEEHAEPDLAAGHDLAAVRGEAGRLSARALPVHGEAGEHASHGAKGDIERHAEPATAAEPATGAGAVEPMPDAPAAEPATGDAPGRGGGQQGGARRRGAPPSQGAERRHGHPAEQGAERRHGHPTEQGPPNHRPAPADPPKPAKPPSDDGKPGLGPPDDKPRPTPEPPPGAPPANGNADHAPGGARRPVETGSEQGAAVAKPHHGSSERESTGPGGDPS